ncbi:hypothetical protein GEMRC1_011832 [Eukaryota sp. GEM-RC1]
MSSVLSDKPLMTGSVFKWKVRYSGMTCNVNVGVAKKKDFPRFTSLDGLSLGASASVSFCGCPSKHLKQSSNGRLRWNPNQVSEVTADMIYYKLTITNSDESWSIDGNLPQLESDDYYAFFSTWSADHVLELVD